MQGFGLRAVAGEATGYAHASELSEDAIRRAGETVRAVDAGLFRERSRFARHAPTPSSIPTSTRSARAEFETKVKLLRRDERLCAREGPARAAGVLLARRRMADGRDHARPAAKPIAISARWCASACRSWSSRTAARNPASYGGGGRSGYETYLDAAILARRRSTKRCARRWSIWTRFRACRRDDGRARPGLARHPAARSDRSRTRRRLQSQEDIAHSRDCSASASPRPA